jgi:hypothetical protein
LAFQESSWYFIHAPATSTDYVAAQDKHLIDAAIYSITGRLGSRKVAATVCRIFVQIITYSSNLLSAAHAADGQGSMVDE